MAMTKVAIAGTNGLAQLIAHYIASTSSHQFVLLSRRSAPGLTAKGWQVLVVDYENAPDLAFKLAGIDIVISTVKGDAQLRLIEAAASVQVRRFVPSEFGGPPGKRAAATKPTTTVTTTAATTQSVDSLDDQLDDRLEDKQREALLRLSQLEASTGMAYTVFTCGVLYERFGPGGLWAWQIAVQGSASSAGAKVNGDEGKYLLDIRQKRAQLPYHAPDGNAAKICVTGARDVARFVVAVLDQRPLSQWPHEFRMCGERMSVRALVSEAEQALNCALHVSRYSRSSLADALVSARAVRDQGREMQLLHLVATAEGRYDFAHFNLNEAVFQHQPERFGAYLARVWRPSADG